MQPDVHDKYLALVLAEAEASVRRETSDRARRREERKRLESRIRVCATKGRTSTANHGARHGWITQYAGPPPD